MNTSVRSADRTMAIFEAFEKVRKPMQLREIAEHCDLPASTCHALVQTLIKRGYLYTMGRRKELYPSVRLLTMAQTIAETDPFIARMTEDLERLSIECGETITVGKQQGDAVLYLYALEGPRAIRYGAKAGQYRAMHSTALGKALLSQLDPAALRAWVEARDFERITRKTITSRSRLLQEIEEGRERGYFTATEEQAEDLSAIAVPLDHPAETLALSLTGPTQRMLPMAEKFSRMLLRIKQEFEGRGVRPKPLARRASNTT
ncbi:MAG: IclR family transcriptional regulator [Burkholderiaceae bacterium]|nr:IclR family transcriptional regulator [Burkholderiaceae bacterium]